MEHKHTSTSGKSHQGIIAAADRQKKFNRCSLQVRRIPLDSFRKPTDGRKWHQSARSRYSLLLKISTYANSDGTFLSKDGKTNFSPSAKTLQRHMAEKTLYRLTDDLRELGFLSWKREKEHYGRRTYTIHFQPKKHLSYSKKKQVSYSKKHLSPRQVITPVTMTGDNTCQIEGKTQESTGVNPVKSAPHPSLESLPSIGSVTGGARAAAESCTNTPPKKASSATLSAFLLFGFDRPFGHPRFQEAVLRNSAEIKDGNQLEAMENVIVELDGKVPPLWYAVKHDLEETLQSAAVRSEAQVGSPRPSRKTTEAFSRSELETYYTRNAAKLERAAERLPVIAQELREIAQTVRDRWAAVSRAAYLDIDSLDREFTVLEEKLFALMKKQATEEQISQILRSASRSIESLRKLPAEEMARLKNQYIAKRLFEAFEIPRLGLFYLL